MSGAFMIGDIIVDFFKTKAEEEVKSTFFLIERNSIYLYNE